MSPVSSGSQKARQPTIVVGPPTFPLPSLPLRIQAATSGSHPLRLGQGDASSLLRITPSGESSLSPFSAQHRAVFSWPAATFRSMYAPKCWKNALGAAREAKIRHPLPTRLDHTPLELRHFSLICLSCQSGQLNPAAGPTQSHLAGNCCLMINFTLGKNPVQQRVRKSAIDASVLSRYRFAQ